MATKPSSDSNNLPVLREKACPCWREYVSVAILCALTSSIYLLYTDHIWEDYFITVKHSENWAEGRGLVYHEGERVHGFTSPIGTLIPAIIHWLITAEDYRPTLNVFRVCCVLTFAATGMTWIAFLARGQWSVPWRWLFLLLFALEPKIVMFSVNGMESAYLLFFLAATAVTIQAGLATAWLWIGFAWAGLMYSRPDGCVYIAGTALLGLLYFSSDRKAAIRGIVLAGLVTAVLYLPWFLGTWYYYGSPVPHTISAKGVDERTLTFMRWLQNGWFQLAATIRPTYSEIGGWPPWLIWPERIVAVLAAIYCILPIRDAVGRWASAAYLLFAAGYLGIIPKVFPWYYPPVTALMLIAIVAWLRLLSGEISSLASGQRPRATAYLLPAMGAILVVAHISFYFVSSTEQMAVQQQEIEWQVRAEVGKYLNQHMSSTDTAYLECLGYIGYFANHHMDDFPGLVSPRVVKIRRGGAMSYADVANVLAPEWIVCRPWEFNALAKHPGIAGNYQVVEVINRLDAIEKKYPDLPGRSYLEYDSRFLILRRVSTLAQRPAN